jgi:hypothetical protein
MVGKEEEHGKVRELWKDNDFWAQPPLVKQGYPQNLQPEPADHYGH